MTESEKFLIIKSFIDRMDYCGLLENGCPSDEFDAESLEISRRVQQSLSSLEIAEIVASVFNRAFGEHEQADVFLSVAEQIKTGLKKYS